MKRSELETQTSALWDAVGGGHHTQNPFARIAAPVATVLLLRWTEHALPLSRRWRDLRGEELTRFVSEALTPRPKPDPGQVVPNWWLAHVVRGTHRLEDLAPKVVSTIIRWSLDFDLESDRGRQSAGDALEALLDQANRLRAGGDLVASAPPAVAKLMVDLVQPRAGERIYDPCFGLGGLLVAAASRLAEQVPLIPSEGHGVPKQFFFGGEAQFPPVVIGLARMVLAGVHNPGFQSYSALKEPSENASPPGRFDCILCVPPAGRRMGTGSAINLETQTLQHVMASLRHGGRAVVALPESILFRRGLERQVRRALLTDYRVEGVVALPEEAFQPFSGLRRSLVLFRREEPASTVRFLQAQEWPLYRSNNAFATERTLEAARGVAESFRNGSSNGCAWETPVAKLAERGWELLAKRTGEEALRRSLAVLAEANEEFEARPLGDVAEVFLGVSNWGRTATSDRDDPSVVAGIVRVADVGKRRIRNPSRFLTGTNTARILPEHRLRTGDVLLSASGKIGKAGTVSESSGIVGALAARGLIVIRPGPQVSPPFLRCLLASDTYQDWFHGHARGVSIQHLSIQTLRRLPVPVPELATQERLVRHVTAHDGDALSTFERVLNEGGWDPIDAWLHGPDARELRLVSDATDRLTLLENIAASLQTLRSQVASVDGNAEPSLNRWLLALADSMRTFQGLNHVPAGPERVAILDAAQARIERILSDLAGSRSPNAGPARNATRNISLIVRVERESVLEKVEMEPFVRPSSVPAGKEAEIQVSLNNRSRLALRNVSVSTFPDIGASRVPYLAGEKELSFPVQIPAKAPVGNYRFQVKWRADRLDGQQVFGKAPLAVGVSVAREAAPPGDLGTSPYIVGSPIDREEMFFGREDIIDRIRRQLSTRHRANVVLLEGNRRTGKTSILGRLQAPGVLPDWITVNCSLQGGEGHARKPGLSTNEVFRLMARHVGLAAHSAGLRVWLPDMDPPDPRKRFKIAFAKAARRAFSGSRPFETFELFLQTVIDAARPRRILLMLDEFDKLQEGIDNGITSPQVPENIRYLLHTYAGVSAVLAGSRRLKRLREEYWSVLFGLGYRVAVSELRERDARLLVTRPVEGRLSYVPEARDLVVDLCARHPFLIQSLCNRIFDRAAESGRRLVTVGEANRTATEMVRDNEHFRTLWDYAATERRRLILAWCQRLQEGPDPVTLSLLETKLEESGVIVPRGHRLGDDVEFLRELELVKLDNRTSEAVYALAVPLMGMWIKSSIDFENQRRRAVREGEELDHGR